MRRHCLNKGSGKTTNETRNQSVVFLRRAFCLGVRPCVVQVSVAFQQPKRRLAMKKTCWTWHGTFKAIATFTRIGHFAFRSWLLGMKLDCHKVNQCFQRGKFVFVIISCWKHSERGTCTKRGWHNEAWPHLPWLHWSFESRFKEVRIWFLYF